MNDISWNTVYTNAFHLLWRKLNCLLAWPIKVAHWVMIHVLRYQRAYLQLYQRTPTHCPLVVMPAGAIVTAESSKVGIDGSATFTNNFAVEAGGEKRSLRTYLIGDYVPGSWAYSTCSYRKPYSTSKFRKMNPNIVIDDVDYPIVYGVI